MNDNENLNENETENVEPAKVEKPAKVKKKPGRKLFISEASFVEVASRHDNLDAIIADLPELNACLLDPSPKRKRAYVCARLVACRKKGLIDKRFKPGPKASPKVVLEE